MVQVSAIKGTGLETLLLRIDAALTADPVERIEISVPQSEGKTLAMIEAGAKILNREYKHDCVHLTVEGPKSLLRRLQDFDGSRAGTAIPKRHLRSRQSLGRHLRKR